MAAKTIPWDIQEHIDTPARQVGYLEAAFEDGDPSLIVAAIGDVARARGMTDLARRTELSRESLYRALSPEGNPSFATIASVLDALGLSLAVVRKAEAAA